jgi:hypothetical protein
LTFAGLAADTRRSRSSAWPLFGFVTKDAGRDAPTSPRQRVSRSSVSSKRPKQELPASGPFAVEQDSRPRQHLLRHGPTVHLEAGEAPFAFERPQLLHVPPERRPARESGLTGNHRLRIGEPESRCAHRGGLHTSRLRQVIDERARGGRHVGIQFRKERFGLTTKVIEIRAGGKRLLGHGSSMHRLRVRSQAARRMWAPFTPAPS